MKIGILTFFDGVNFGAYAQVYALHHRLKELGFSNKVIAYKNNEHTINELKSLFYTKNPKIFFINLIKYIKFRIAQRKLDKTISINNPNKINDLGLDIIIVGSDEVWNFENDLFGIDGAYFGAYCSNSKLVSYAGCFGKLTVDDTIPEELKKSFYNFKHLSVRDDNSFNILEKIFKVNSTLVLDPTLLYNFDKEMLNSHITINNNQKYILYYGIGFEEYGNTIIEQIKKFASLKNLKIISVGFQDTWTDENVATIAPFQWMQYIKNASYIITNMFHGTIFSIKFNKQVLIIGSNKRRNKIESLLNHLELLERIIYFSDDNISRENIIDGFKSSIDYTLVNKKIIEQKKKSEDFLINAIEN